MRLLILSFHSCDGWCRYLARNVQAEDALVVSDVRGDGDVCITDDFYKNYRSENSCELTESFFSIDEIADIIERCRTLRNLDRALATRMIGAMAKTYNELLSAWQPTLILAITIDRYTFDIMARLAGRREVSIIEMTTSIIPEHILFMRRGKMIQLRQPEADEFAKYIPILCQRNWAPSYVDQETKFNAFHYWKTFLYHRLRSYVFDVYRHLRRDPLNIHYLEALPKRSHRVRLSDANVLTLFRKDWEQCISTTPIQDRVFLALQVFPESSIDYWIAARELLDHDNVIMSIVKTLCESGFTVFVKDHPNQFGFRKRELIDRLAAEENVVLVPYHVPGGLLLEACPYTVTLTSTVGFQAAMMGKCAVVVDPYYAEAEAHFIKFKSIKDIDELPKRMRAFVSPIDLLSRQKEIIGPCLAASAPGDIYSYLKFKEDSMEHQHRVAPLIATLNLYLPNC